MIKLACTTLACPDWDLDTVLAKFKQYGYQAVDFRGLGQQINVWTLPEFTTGLDQTVRKIAASGLAVSAFSSSARMFSATPAERAKHVDEVRQYARLCRATGCAMIRVFGGPIGTTPLEAAVAASADTLAEMSACVGPDIKLAVETHDEWIESKRLAMVMARINLPNIGLLWDLHHPFRMAGETPAQTYANIGRYVIATHLKDSRPTADGKYEYTLGGAGDVPLAQMVRLLKQGGYDGYLTLEWEKKWIPTLPEPDVALPQYAQFMAGLVQ